MKGERHWKVEISKRELHNLYWKKKMPILKIAKLLKVSPTTISNYLKRYGIPKRKLSDILYEISLKRYKRRPFSKNQIEKYYLLGLRAGDISAYKPKRGIRVSVGTTHPAMMKLFDKVFGKYSKSYKLPVKTRDYYEWFLRCTLHESFKFMIKKPKNIPKKENLFYSFLSAFADCEGSWIVSKSHDKFIQTMFILRNSNYGLLKQIEEKLRVLGYHPKIELETRKGDRVGRWKLQATKNTYKLFIRRRRELVSLAKHLLAYSKHEEKIKKMKLIIQTSNETKWQKIKDEVLKIREEIKKGVKGCIKKAKEEWYLSHNSKLN